MSKPTKSNIAIFKNTKPPLPDAKYAPCDYNGKITLVEPLPAGEYEAAIYLQQSAGGLSYMRGNIRPAWKPKEVFVAPKPPATDESDEIPF